MPSSTPLPSRRGADRVVERFRESRGTVQRFPRFDCMEVLRAEAGDEVLDITPGWDREAFESPEGAVGRKELVRGPIHPTS